MDNALVLSVLASPHILWSVSVLMLLDCVISAVWQMELQPVCLLSSWVKNGCIEKQGDPVATLKATSCSNDAASS